MKVSVLLLTFNEASNLPRCLDAIQWCEDIIVVDSGSTDGTVEMARERGARVLHREFDNFAAQRNFGISEGRPKHDWVLHLDADEVVTEAFIRELSILQPPTGIEAYYVPSKLMLRGRWLRYAGMYPVYQVRLGHRDRLRFKQVGHGQREDLPADRIGIFREPYLHYNFSHGLSAWLWKHVKYAEDEARLHANARELDSHPLGVRGAVARRRTLKSMSRHLPLWLRPLARMIYLAIARRAFLDGGAGLLYVGMMGIYEAMIALQVYDESLARAENRQRNAASPSGDVGART